jgi:hypothetical protein
MTSAIQVAQAAPKLNDALKQALKASEHHCVYALVDGALLLDLPKAARLRWLPSRGLSLLNGSMGHGVLEVGPLLYELSDSQINSNLPESLLDATSGRAAGSFIVSNQKLGDLAAYLSRFVDVQLEDRSTMIMRFFDPRILQFWLNVIKPNYITHLAEVLSKWVYWDASLSIAMASFERASPGNGISGKGFPIKLSVAEEECLMEASYPFTMIERFRAEDPVALEKIPAEDRYGFFQGQMNRARHHGIQSFSEMEIYCGLSIAMGPRFDEDRAIGPALLHLKNGKSLIEALVSVEDEVWVRLRGQS